MLQIITKPKVSIFVSTAHVIVKLWSCQVYTAIESMYVEDF